MNLLSLELLLVLGSLVQGLQIEPKSQRADGIVNPIAIDSVTPRLSWRLTSKKRGDNQTAYQVQASTSDNSWASPDLWDSGWVTSSDSFVSYAGKALGSRSAVYWRVRVKNVDGRRGCWSEPSSFEVGLLEPSDWTASWIGNSAFRTNVNSLPTFAKEFNVECPVSKARLYMLGLGVHQPEINGEEVTDTLLAPGYSTFNKTLLYSTYDVTKHLKSGANVLGTQLGKGIWNSDKPYWGKRYTKFTNPSRPLMLIGQLEYTCQGGEKHTIKTDDSWVTTVDGPYLEAHWFGGEEYNALREMPDWSKPGDSRQNWTKAELATPPTGVMASPRSPQMKKYETVPAVKVFASPDMWVYDFGVNNAGTFTFKIDGRGLKGKRITFWPAERLKANGLIDQSTMGTNIFHAYTIKGEAEEIYSPKFHYQGMQMLGINKTIGTNESYPWPPPVSAFSATRIRASNENVLSVETSNDLFNKIHKLIDNSIQGNMHSVLTDCPHREKLGWLEQDQLTIEPVGLGYDIEAYGTDLVRTIADSQAEDIPGMIPTTSPEYVVFSGNLQMYRDEPNWGVAMIRFPLFHYQYYGDINILKMRHTQMTEYMDYLIRRAGGKNYMAGNSLGDWLTLNNATPKSATVTFGYHSAAIGLAQVEEYLGNSAKAAEYRALAASIAQGYHEQFFNTTAGTYYCTNTQACNAMALDMGAVPEDKQEVVLASMISSLEQQGWHWDVGEISLPSLIRVLRKEGREDVLYKLYIQETIPSYGSQVVHGSTALWEHWDAPTTGGSYNHFMFGYGDIWVVQLSGLAQGNSSKAWEKIDYKPNVVGELTSASTSYRTPRGTASAAWKLNGGSLEYKIEVPVGSVGTVTLKGTSITLDGKKIEEGKEGVTKVTDNAGRTIIQVGSGSYAFGSTMN